MESVHYMLMVTTIHLMRGIVKSQNGILSIDCDYVGIRVQGNTVVVEQLGIRLGQRHAEHSAALA